MSTIPKISVLIPSYNSEKYIEDCLQSILKQSLRPYEIIVVDDGSSDQTVQVLLAYKEVKVICQEKKGVSFARNTALAESIGEFIAFQDADDLWFVDKLKLQFEFLSNNPDIGLVFSKMKNFIDPTINDQSKTYWEHFQKKNIDPIGLPSMLSRRSVFEIVGNFNTALPLGEDLDWFSRVEEAGIKKKIMPDLLARRRLHDSNTTLLPAEDQQAIRLKLIQSSLFRQRGNNAER